MSTASPKVVPADHLRVLCWLGRYGLSKEALVKKFLFDRERAHQNSTARARKAGPVTIPTTPTVPIASPTPVETSNHQVRSSTDLIPLGIFCAGRTPQNNARGWRRARRRPRLPLSGPPHRRPAPPRLLCRSWTSRASCRSRKVRSDTVALSPCLAAGLADGGCLSAAGAEIFEQRLQELSKNTDGIDTGGMDYIDSWAQQNAASTPSPAK